MKQISIAIIFFLSGVITCVDAQVIDPGLLSPFRIKNSQSFGTAEPFGERWSVGGQGNLFIKTRNGQRSTTISKVDLNSLFFIDRQTGFVVGNSGEILLTRDRGATWQRQDSPMKVNLQSVYCLNAKTCWIVGWEKGTLLIGGVDGNWKQSNIVPNGRLTDTFIVDNTVGYVVGWDGLILKTTDGGRTWSQIGIPYKMGVSEFMDGTPNYEAVVFKDSSRGCVAGWGMESGIAACTLDGGRSWRVNYPDTTPQGIVWDKNDKITVVGENGKNFVSRNFGRTWRLSGSPYGIRIQ